MKKSEINPESSKIPYVKHMSKSDFRELKRNLILADKAKEIPLSRGVSPVPTMQQYIGRMASKDTNVQQNNSKMFAGSSMFTKKSFSKRGKAVRTVYNYILKGNHKRTCLNYINNTAQYLNYPERLPIIDESKLKELKERDIAKVLIAKPNTTIKLASITKVTTKNGIREINDTLTFTPDLFKRNIKSLI